MENAEEKMEAMEQAIDSFIPKMQEMQTAITEQAKVKIPDYKEDFDKIIQFSQKTSEGINKSLTHFKESVNVLIEVIQSIPKQEPVQHHHHFDIKSKVFVTSFVIMLLTVAVSIGLAVSFGIGYMKRYHEATSYSIVRAFYPKVAKYVDNAYSTNAEEIIREAEIRIEEQKTLSSEDYERMIDKRDKKRSKDQMKSKRKRK
ncbi:hypothetical protein [Pedobacter hartonius]|uniref:Uncharacterized protein n=1 Tax=Pedobacter hartonius TaxID=425514 RepID=A0A1H4HKF9_9SPHI|nr:hypothetical protein [Pedobacter hartonius]SEB22347.1 hypothetical protein SAMN05443550_1332 [Pedobacter hartonius]